MKEWLLVNLCLALIFTVWDQAQGFSERIMKTAMCIAICATICFVWFGQEKTNERFNKVGGWDCEGEGDC